MEGTFNNCKVISPILFRVADRKKTYVLHHDRLKPCLDRDIPLWLRRKRNQLLATQDGIESTDLGGVSSESNEPTYDNLLDSDSLNLDKLFTPDNSACSPLYNEMTSTEDQEDDSHSTLTDSPPGSQLDAQDLPEEPGTTRSGRKTKPPGYLADYIS